MPIPALVGAALISSAASTGTSAMQNSSNNKRAKENALLERQWQLEDRLHDEQYNSPSAQMQRLRAAGINPLLSGGAANVEQVPTQSNTVDGPVNVPQTDLGALVGSSFSNLATASDLELRKEELELAKKKTNKDIEKIDSDIEVNKSVEDLNRKLGVKTDQEANAIGEQFKKLVTENKYLDDQLKKQLEIAGIDLDEKKLAYKFNYDTLNDRMENLRLTNKQIKKDIDRMASEIGVNKATAAYTYGKLKELNMELAYGMPYWKARSIMYGAKKDGVEYNLVYKGYKTQRAIQEKEKGDAEFHDSETLRWVDYVADKTKDLLTGALMLFGSYKLSKGVKIYQSPKPGKPGAGGSIMSKPGTTPPGTPPRSTFRPGNPSGSTSSTGNIYYPH